jgi:hypothetical protein
VANLTLVLMRKARYRNESPVRGGRGWLFRCVAAVTVLGVLGLLAWMLPSRAPVSAAGGRLYDKPPFYSGARIVNNSRVLQGHSWCTAGPVMMKDWRHLPIVGGRAGREGQTRWIITAGHCGEVSDEFRAVDGAVLGSVDFKDPQIDVLTIKVEPSEETTAPRECSSGSSSYCVEPAQRFYDRRAVARIYTGDVTDATTDVYSRQATPSTPEEASRNYYFSGAVSGLIGPFHLDARALQDGRVIGVNPGTPSDGWINYSDNSGAPLFRRNPDRDIEMVGWMTGFEKGTGLDADAGPTIFHTLSEYQQTEGGRDKVIANTWN